MYFFPIQNQKNSKAIPFDLLLYIENVKFAKTNVN